MRKSQHRTFQIISCFLLLVLIVSILPFNTNTIHAAGSLQGVALKSPTNVYENTSTNSNVLKDYQKGTILKYDSYNSSWYSATVYTNGGWKKGFINKSDVDTATSKQTNLEGVALKSPTTIYGEANTDSRKLKSYRKGSILIYKTFTDQWYEATVYAYGKWRTGYIHKSHVDNAVKDQSNVSGIGLKKPTVVYKEASTNSQELKSYNIGSKLYYRTYSSEWYEATIYTNGTPKTGYIHKSHVDGESQQNTSFKGIALRDSTHVHLEASTASNALKSYPAGSILYYRSFTENWFKATVYFNGKPRTGYIHRSHVENAVKEQINLKGIGLKNSTPIYSRATTGSKALKSYNAGTVLQYKTFSSNWYEATVYLNGKAKTGYIHTNHVEGIYDTHKKLEGRALKKPTNIYSLASKSSRVLKDYGEGSILKFKTFSPNWYQATVYLNDKPRIGYIHREDVTTEDVTNIINYSYGLDKMVGAQMNANPQTDLTGGKGWQHASKNQVQYYTHPNNFEEGTKAYFQFLDISHSAGLDKNDATILNQKFLNNTGTLSGRAQAFINGGNKYHVNELYLLSHALLETGYGGSTLAKGVSTWTKRTSSGNIVKDKSGNPIIMDISPKKVYNMYGIGAFDSCPYDCGAQRAYDNGWFDPETAITEGAAFASKNYINNGQNTLYEMRWNPGHLEKYNYASHQYASDVGWAVKQTNKIYDMYQSVASNFTLVFEVPHFIGQQNAPKGSTTWQGSSSTLDSKVTTYPAGVIGVTNTQTDLNFRSTPNSADNDNIIGSIPNGSELDILGTNGSWYNVKYNSKTGWVHGDYVVLLNLLKSKDTVNIRKSPQISDNKYDDQLEQGDLVTAVLTNMNLDKKEADGYVWYEIYYGDNTAWVSTGPTSNSTEYMNFVK
ncbi:SH3 domain-containing protein [Virgibacillus byunsanensis]|uniref:SH3 domain-containing protein n=1 Tax=Virgibacillus byunsanensis TaxID=570945 RepID=A0ABW3LJM7_9BACI